MSTKVKRKVTVENNESIEAPRRQSVFERLGPGTIVSSQSQERNSRGEQMEKCRNWLRTGNCSYGSNCRYQHDPFPSGTRIKTEKDIDEKDLRHKVRNKREETKDSSADLGSSPKRRGHKRSLSRNRRSDHDSKIKSTVVVTRPRSPTSENEFREKKRIQEGSWEDDSDDWPVDVSQLDYKEELTLERKRQQLQREIELELQKERMINENVTITKTVSVSGSSSSSSDSDSETSSSDSSSSSSGDSDDSSSSSSSSSESSPVRVKKKISSREVGEKYHNLKSNLKSKDKEESGSRNTRLQGGNHISNSSPESQSRKRRKGKIDIKSFSPKRSTGSRDDGLNKRSDYRGMEEEISSGSLNKSKGPRTPSPSDGRTTKQRSLVSLNVENRNLRSKGKRHKKRRDGISKDEANHRDTQPPTPPPLSSPNRCAVASYYQFGKKPKFSIGSEKGQQKPDSSLPPFSGKSHSSRGNVSSSNENNRRTFAASPEIDKSIDKKLGQRDLPWHISEQKMPTDETFSKQSPLRQSGDRKKMPVRKRELSNYKDSPSMSKDKGNDASGYKVERKLHSRDSSVGNRNVTEQRRRSVSPVREKDVREPERKRIVDDFQRNKNSRSESLSRIKTTHEPENYNKKDQLRRAPSPDLRKLKGSKDVKNNPSKYRSNNNSEYWNEEQNKQPYGKPGHHQQETRTQTEQRHRPSLPNDRSEKERDSDRGRKREREKNRNNIRDENRTEKLKVSSPNNRSQSPFHDHSMIRGLDMPNRDVSPVMRGRRYDRDVSCGREHDYIYGGKALNETSYMDDRYPIRNERGPDMCRNLMYSPEQYRDTRYRRESNQTMDRYGGYSGKDLHSMNSRLDNYVQDIPLDDHIPLDDRWNRNRPIHRDTWDNYGGLVDNSMPLLGSDMQRIPYDLEEDRYSMRNSRHSEWTGMRQEKRDRIHSPSGKSKSSGAKEKLPPVGNYNEKGSYNEKNSYNEKGSYGEQNNYSDKGSYKEKSNYSDKGNYNEKRTYSEKGSYSDKAAYNDKNTSYIEKENFSEKGSPYTHSALAHRQDLKEKPKSSPARHTPVDLSPASCGSGSNDPANTHLNKSSDRSRGVSKERQRSKFSRKQSREKTKSTTGENNTNEKSVTGKKRQQSPSGSNGRDKRRKVNDITPSKKKKEAISEVKKEPVQSSSPSTSRKAATSAVEENIATTTISTTTSTVIVSPPTTTTATTTSSTTSTTTSLKAVETAVKNDNSEKKVQKENTNDTANKIPDPEFSDWSEDDDDDLLTRDIPGEDESKKPETTSKDVISVKSELIKSETLTEPIAENKHETESKEIVPQDDEKQDILKKEISSISKPTEIIEDSIEIADEIVDYDPISDDELDAILGDQDEGDSKFSEVGEKNGIFDALEVDWDSLQNKTKAFVPGKARKRFTTAKILAQIGFSQNLIGPAMSAKILEYCQKQIEKESNTDTDENEEGNEISMKELKMEHPVAAFHVNISTNKKERGNVLYNLGPYRHALCARQDLQMRRLLCKPSNKMLDSTNAYHPPNTVDTDLYKQSLELWKQKISCPIQKMITAPI